VSGQLHVLVSGLLKLIGLLCLLVLGLLKLIGYFMDALFLCLLLHHIIGLEVPLEFLFNKKSSDCGGHHEALPELDRASTATLAGNGSDRTVCVCYVLYSGKVLKEQGLSPSLAPVPTCFPINFGRHVLAIKWHVRFPHGMLGPTDKLCRSVAHDSS
jgi:hypothetical protein